MSTDLSWFDRNIIPLTKNYRDFIKAKESTPPERWNKDGERKFSNKERKYLQIHQNRVKKPSAAPIVPEVPMVPVVEKKVIEKTPEIENQIAVSEENEIIVGKTTRYDLSGKVTEVKEFTSEESYLKAVQEQIGRTNFKNETLLRDPELLKKVDDLLALDRKSILPLEYYIDKVKKEMEDISVQESPEIEVGKITKFDIIGKGSETKVYNSTEDYLKALELTVDRPNFKHETVLRDPELLKRVDDLLALDRKSLLPLEHYIEMVRIEKQTSEPVVGTLSFYDYDGKVGETVKYTSNESYLNALSSNFDSLPIGSFKHETLLRDPELLKAVDDLVYGVHGEDNPNSLEYYINLVKNEDRFERSNAEKPSMISDIHPEIDAIADKLRQRYQIEEDPSIPLNSPNAKVFLQQAIEIAKMPEEVQKAALDYINTVAFENLVKGDEFITTVDSGKFVTGDEPEFLEKTASLEKFLFHNEIQAGKLPKLESSVANYFTVLVGELKRNFSHEIGQINSTNQFNYYEIRITHQKDQEQLQHHKDQLKYLGFGEGEKLRNDLKEGIDSHQKNFEIKAVANKTQLGNTVSFAIKYARLDQGDIVLNSYDGNLTNDKGTNILQNFKVTKDNHFSAKEAINLLEGRAVKIEYTNPITDLREKAFVKLNLLEEKNKSGNYNFQTFSQDYGINTRQIVEKSNIIFDRPEQKENALKSLEQGDIVKVKISIEDKLIEAKTVLNPQYKTLNLYDSEMNRINTNKPLQGMEITQTHQKSNAREQSLSRGI